MANAQKYTKAACGHLAAHYERKMVKNPETGEMEYIKFGNQEIDPSRTHLNYNLAPEREGGQLDFIRQRTTEARTLNRADVNVMVSWVLTLPQYEQFNPDPNIHISPNKDLVERLFFERSYEFLRDRYGEQNVISAYVHKDEVTPHIHFAFVPVVADPKRGGEKVSAKEVITRDELRAFHTDLERYLDGFKDWRFKVVNEATKDGNKEVAELKKQTAHEEVLKEQQKAREARIAAEKEREGIKPLQEKKKALEGEIVALQTEKEVLTAAEVEAVKGEKTLFGGLKGVTHKQFEAVHRTAAAVDEMAAKVEDMQRKVDAANLRAEKAERAVNAAYADANKQLQQQVTKIQSSTRDEIERLRADNISLTAENRFLQNEVSKLKRKVQELTQIIKDRLPEVYKTLRSFSGRER